MKTLNNISFIFLFFTLMQFNVFSQESDVEKHYNNYCALFSDVKALNFDDGPGAAININYNIITPLKIKSKPNLNLKSGGELGLYLFPQLDIISFRFSYILGYSFEIDNSFSVQPNIKPFASITIGEEKTYDAYGIEESSEPKIDFDFNALLGVDFRYFFSDKSKFGLIGGAYTSFNGGNAINVGVVWRSF